MKLEDNELLNLKNITFEKKSNTKNESLSLLNSLKIGLFSFGIVFLFLLFVKLLAVSASSRDEFSVGMNEFIFSIWGFLIGSFITISPTLKSLLKKFD